MSVQCACPIRLAAIEIVHPKPKNGTPVYTKNYTTKGTLTASM